MKANWYNDPTIGNIEAERFDPATWKTEYPNPAFNQMDAADAFWAASILARFTDPIVRSIVEDAQLSHREGAEYLANVIIKRRDKTVRWAIALANPLDRFAVKAGSAPELTFDNAAVRLGISTTSASYRVRWSSLDNRTGTEQPIGNEITTTEAREAVPASAWGPADDAGIRYAVASIATVDSAHPHWATPVTVTIREKSGAIDIVGINRLPITK
jgi:hypothetical protein